MNRFHNKVILVVLVFVTYLFFRSKINNIKFANNFFIEIKLQDASLVFNEGIGNEIYMKSYTEDLKKINHEFLKLNLSNKHRYKIISETIDNDPNHDDVGRSEYFISPKNIDKILQNSGFEIEVKTYEHYGNGAGKVATSKFKYIVKKSLN